MGNCLGRPRRHKKDGRSSFEKSSSTKHASGKHENGKESGRMSSNGDSHRSLRNAKSPSILSESDWHECQEAFSVSDPAGSNSQRYDDGSDTSDENEGDTNQVGCMSVIDSMLRPAPTESADGPNRAPSRPRSRRVPKEGKPAAGCSLALRDHNTDWADVREAYEDCDCTTFKVRGQDYIKSKQKVNSEQSFYRLAAADLFSFETKESHLAKKLGQLPTGPNVPAGCNIPQLIILNLQLPSYSPSFFGGSNDGPGHCIVYYFVLRDDFNHETANPAALGLLQRFVANGRESDGTPTRERLKLLPRVVNVDEWQSKGHLSGSEHKLLSTYNEKPLLTRPQQQFFTGPNYLEVDLDIHSYSILARKALHSFFSRLKEVVWENAFVIQGNSSEELPEVVLGAARLYRTDFDVKRPFSDYVNKRPSQSGGGSSTNESAPAAAAAAPSQTDGTAAPEKEGKKE